MNKDVLKGLDSDQNATRFSLDLKVGGSITGPTFNVKIKDAEIVYQEFDVEKEIKKIERNLTNDEFSLIKKYVIDANLLSTESPDYSKKPIAPDSGFYVFKIAIKDMEPQNNSISCAIESDPTGISVFQTIRECNLKMIGLVKLLNEILGVKIY